MRRLAEEKAPTVITQLVLWNVGSGLDWGTIAGLAKDSANPYELSLARQFVANLDKASTSKDDSGRIYVDVRRRLADGGRAEGPAQGPPDPRPEGGVGRPRDAPRGRPWPA